MTRFYNKQKEAEKWEGPLCPKIKKKLLKFPDQANICYVLPAGKGIFQVQERQSTFIVDVVSKHCDCRRWDLTGIPCCRAIACIREERLSEQDLLPFCYSIEAFKSVYDNNIMPCSDKAKWEKMNGPQVLPPVYEKKVGRQKKLEGSNLQKYKENLVQNSASMELPSIAVTVMRQTTIRKVVK